MIYVFFAVWFCAALYLLSRKASAVISIGGGFLLGCLSLIPTAILLGEKRISEEPRAVALSTSTAPVKFSREQFMVRFNGKPAQELLDILGPPSRRQQSTASPDYWYYTNVTYDTLTKKEDSSVQIVIELSRVKQIGFY